MKPQTFQECCEMLAAAEHERDVYKAKLGDWAAARAMAELLGSRGIPGGTSYVELEADAAEAHGRIAKLEAQLPDGMKDCTIVFRECPLGHGWLTATNWIDHGCPTCRITAETEACAQVAEEHPDHIDILEAGDSEGQSHVEPPFRCNVATAIRARKRRSEKNGGNRG